MRIRDPLRGSQRDPVNRRRPSLLGRSSAPRLPPSVTSCQRHCAPRLIPPSCPPPNPTRHPRFVPSDAAPAAGIPASGGGNNSGASLSASATDALGRDNGAIFGNVAHPRACPSPPLASAVGSPVWVGPSAVRRFREVSPSVGPRRGSRWLFNPLFLEPVPISARRCRCEAGGA